MSDDRLAVERLSISFRDGAGWAPAVRDVSLEVRAGSTTALVGESGCGKSVTALGVLGLLPRRAARIDSGRIILRESAVDTDLRSLDEPAMRAVRGRRIAMIFQEPMTALNPVMSVGRQVLEAVERRGRAARTAAIESLRAVGVDDAERRLGAYPHELSGGQRQRILIAAALAGGARWLLADEPTTALDVTVQRRVLDLLRSLQRDRGLGMLFITHALPVAAAVADRIVVMLAGRVVEAGPAREVLARPLHPYTRSLVDASPEIGRRPAPARDGWRSGAGDRIGDDFAWAPVESWGEPRQVEIEQGRTVAVRAAAP